LMTTDPGDGKVVADPPPPEQIGAFRLVRLLGRGGMGAVYEAVRNDGVFEQRVAIKLLASRRWSEEIQQRFANERQILARLEQRNIARIYDGGVAPDGHSFIVMEYIDGQSIIDYADQRALDQPARLGLVQQLCGALQFAHQQLVVHADIKPNNILVTTDGSVKLLDFGISQLLDRPGQVTRTSGPASREPLTAAYAAPERAAGGPPTVAGDVYSLGIVLRELLVAGNVSAPLPDGLTAVIAKATANNPADRYGSVAALGSDLRRWLRKLPLSAVSDSWRYRSQLFLSRNRAAVIVGTVTLLGLSTATAVATRSYFTAERARAAEAARFDEARSLSSYLVNDLSDEMRSRPGMSDAHRKTMYRTECLLRCTSRRKAPATDSR
jgi:eukaryotic-like serine/threonine-protein kinase